MPLSRISRRSQISEPAPIIAAVSPAILSSRRSPKLPALRRTSPAFPIPGRPRMPPSETTIEAPLRHVHKALQHDSGAKHVQGSAEYIDDMLEPAGTLHIALGGSPVARGVIRHVDLADVLSMPGVVTVITAAHIPGRNDISPTHADEPVFAHDRVDYHNQPIFAVVATTRDVARRAALRGKIEIAVETPNVSVEQGRASGERVLPDYAFIGGDAAKAIAEAPYRTTGTFHIGGQEHFYLEGQIA